VEIEIQLDEERLNKLTLIRQQTNQNIAQVIQQAIDLYYQQLQRLQNGSIENQRQELETAYREASLELDPAWESTVADGLSDETW